MHVLICGAGPTGLVAAHVLTANGVPCRIIEKRTEPSPSSRALGLQARSMEILSGLGIAEEVARVSYRLRGAAIMRGNKKLVQMRWIPPQSPYPHTYVLPQSGLEDILRARLEMAGVEVEWGTELVDAEHSRSGVDVKLADGRTISTEWLIGADGARSRVRDSIGIPFVEHATGETYYLADAQLELPVDIGDSAMWLGASGPLMLMRLPGDTQSWRAFVDMTDHGDAQLPPLTEEKLARLLEERGPQGAEVISLDWTSIFRTRVGLAATYSAGNVSIAGDAAHVFPPFGGQGMNLGIQDAMNLGWRLSNVIARGGDETLTVGYEQERRPIAQTTIRDVETRRKMFALRNPIARAARDTLLRIGGGSQRAQRRASLQNSQLLTSYRDTVIENTNGPDPRPGDRAPDGPFQDGTVHELFGPDHVTLLHFAPTATESAVSRDEGVHTATLATGGNDALRRIYSVGDGEEHYVLVRPDGHIAQRGRNADDIEFGVRLMVGGVEDSR